MKKRKGAALIIAVLLSAIVGSAAIGVSAIATRQVRISDTYNKGLVAFYAAESGLEQGLLQYKHNQNIEIPEDFTVKTEDVLQRNSNKTYRNFLNRTPMRFDVTNNKGVDIGYNGTSKSLGQIYDLQVFYKQKYYGTDTQTAGGDYNGFIDPTDIQSYQTDQPKTYTIRKDEAATFQLLPTNATANPATINEVHLYWRWQRACTNKPRALEVKIKTEQSDPLTKKKEYTKIFYDPRCGTISGAGPSDVAKHVIATDPWVFNTGQELKASLGISALTATEFTLKPVGGGNTDDYIWFGFNQSGALNPSSSLRTTGPNTTVRSIGYFGGTTREITANISRQNGTVLDLFQYVIYQGQ